LPSHLNKPHFMHAPTSRSLHPTARLGLIALAASLATGCSVLQEDKIDYKSAKQTSTLDVPPDLTQLSRDSRYQVPGSVVTASGYQTAQPATASSTSTAVTRWAMCASNGRATSAGWWWTARPTSSGCL
jgi:outer membrane protein assembly factor BamC